MKIENRFFWQPSPPTCIGTEQLQCDPRSLVPELVASRSPSPLSGSCIWSLSRRVRRAESCRSLHAYSALPEYVHTHTHTHTHTHAHTHTHTHTLTVIPSHSVSVHELCVLSHSSHVLLFVTLWTVACQAPLPMAFSRQEYWSGLPCPPPGDLRHPGIKPYVSCICRQVLYHWASLVGQRLKRLPPMQETQVQSLGWGDPLEKEMVTHSGILAWRIPWTEEPGRLQSTGSQRDGHD